MSYTTRAKTFRSEFPQIETGIYAILILPIVAIKQFMTQLYDLVVHMIWSNFTQGRTYELLAIYLVLFVFCLLSLISYFLRNYDGLLITGSLLIWFFDYSFAQSEYCYGEKRASILLISQNDGCCIWQQRSPNGKSKQVSFRFEQVNRISITRNPILGGAFQTSVANVWRVKIIFCDDMPELLIYQEHIASKAFHKGKDLAVHFKVSLTFAHSQGQNPYATDPLDLHHLRRTESFPQTIRVRSSADQWQIDSQWHLSSSWFLLWQISEQSSFLLFVVVMINLMICVGKLLFEAIAILPIQFLSNPSDLTSLNVLPWLLNNFDWTTVGEFAFAIIVTILKGAELSKEEHLCITSESLQFSLGNQKIAEIAVSQIEATLFIQQPQPMILILSDQQAIEVPGLQQEIEFRAMLLKLDEALTQIRSLSS